MTAEQRAVDTSGLNILVATGRVEDSGLLWCLRGSKPATHADLLAVAALLTTAAQKLKDDPELVDTRIEA